MLQINTKSNHHLIRDTHIKQSIIDELKKLQLHTITNMENNPYINNSYIAFYSESIQRLYFSDDYTCCWFNQKHYAIQNPNIIIELFDIRPIIIGSGSYSFLVEIDESIPTTITKKTYQTKNIFLTIFSNGTFLLNSTIDGYYEKENNLLFLYTSQQKEHYVFEQINHRIYFLQDFSSPLIKKGIK